MLKTWIHRIKPGKEARLRDWFGELASRSGELRDSFAAAGIRAEQAFVLSGITGSLLIYVSDADHQGHAAEVYAQSELAIDVQHRQVMDECIEETLSVSPVYNV